MKDLGMIHAKIASINIRPFKWQSQFLDNYTNLTSPMQKLVRVKDEEIKDTWTDEHTKVFEEIKSSFTSKKMLVHPDFDEDFMQYTDASKVERNETDERT